MTPALLLVLAGLAGAPPEAAPEAHLVDMMVAQVGTTVITLSELIAETRLALLRSGGPEVARAPSLSPSLLSAVLRTLVTRELMVQEFRRLNLTEPADSEVQKTANELRDRFPSPADWDRFLEKSGLKPAASEGSAAQSAPPALMARVLAELEANMFLEVRVRRVVAVRETDVATCYEANRAHFGDRSFAEVRGVIRLRLTEQAEAAALKALTQQLEQKTTVRYGAVFAGAEHVEAEDTWTGFRCPEPRKER